MNWRRSNTRLLVMQKVILFPLKHQESFLIHAAQNQKNDWNNGYLLKVTDEKAANLKALEILLKGCDALFFDLQEKMKSIGKSS